MLLPFSQGVLNIASRFPEKDTYRHCELKWYETYINDSQALANSETFHHRFHIDATGDKITSLSRVACRKIITWSGEPE